MRSCQVCGCASWGPVGDPAEIRRRTEFAVDLPAEAFVRCDNCLSVARADLLQDSSQSTPTAPPDADFGGLGSFLKPVMATLMPSIPAPPTRLERLTVALLRSGMFAKPDGWNLSALLTQEDKPSILIEVARHLESQLDQSVTPKTTAKQPWLVLSFFTRQEFECWVAGFLDAMLVPGAVEGGYSEKFYEAAVAYATKQS